MCQDLVSVREGSEYYYSMTELYSKGYSALCHMFATGFYPNTRMKLTVNEAFHIGFSFCDSSTLANV